MRLTIAAVTVTLALWLAPTGAWAGAQEHERRTVAAHNTNQYDQAAVWYLKGAEEGDVEAQFSLGLIYANGTGVRQNFAQAAFWFRQAAEQGLADQGHADAQYGLGLRRRNTISACFITGEQASPKTIRELSRFIEKLMYVKGLGVTQDYIEAYKWFSVAAARGGKEAGKVRDLLTNQMTREQIAEARKLVKQWMESFEKGKLPN